MRPLSAACRACLSCPGAEVLSSAPDGGEVGQLMGYAHGVAFGASLVLAGVAALVVFFVVMLAQGARKKARPRWRWAALALEVSLGGGALVVGSARVRGAGVPFAAVDARMLGAYRPSPVAPGLVPAPYLLLGGDLHCHVAPPDEGYHVLRNLQQTVDLARDEGLDFIALTPHLWTPLLGEPGYRERILAGHRWLSGELRRVDLRGLLVTTGAESTDDSWGHVGLVFGDYEATLQAMAGDEVERSLGDLFQRYADGGGLLTIHHPLAQPRGLAARAFGVDISWRPLTAPSASFPLQIAAADRLTLAFEAYNMNVSELGDWLSFGDREHSVRGVMARMDREIIARQRRLTAVGGSDSHSDFLRPALFVLARERSIAAVREAIASGRTCVRDGAACTFEARAPGGAWSSPGAALEASSSVEVRSAFDARVLVNGVEAARVAAGSAAQISLDPGSCSLLRAVARGGYSSPVYVGCPFAGPTPPG